MVIEEDLQIPILQIGHGRLISTDPSLNVLAVLHPRQFRVYLLEAGSTGQQTTTQTRPSYFRLTLQYEQLLGLHGEHFSAFNMLIAPLGGSDRLDIIVIQAVDGKLQVFERQGDAAFTIQLPNCLIPGPLCYLPKYDSIVTASSLCRLDCYRYGVLSNLSSSNHSAKVTSSNHPTNKEVPPFLTRQSTQEEKHVPDVGLVKQRPLLVEWSILFGEMMIDIKTGRFSSSLPSTQSELIVMGQHSLFLVRDNGAIESQMRIQSEAKYMSIYSSQSTSDKRLTLQNILILTKANMINIYRDMKLIWLVNAIESNPCFVSTSPCFR